MEGKATSNACFAFKNVCVERIAEKPRHSAVIHCLYMKQAVNRIKHGDLMEMLKKINVDGRNQRPIKNLY